VQLYISIDNDSTRHFYTYIPCNNAKMSSLNRIVRGLHTTRTVLAKATPDKSHHVFSYPSTAFPSGYSVSATHCGIKKKAGAHDLGILVSTSPRPTSAAACLTRNVFKAAPVTVSADLLHTAGGRARGFVVNSGCANAVTGKQGLEDAWSMSRGVTSLLPRQVADASTGSGTGEAGTLVMSTGVIGQHLPVDKITSNLQPLVSSLSSSSEAWMNLAKAFMTTDTFPKLRTRSFTLGNHTIKMAGIDKGAGMIAPNMGPPQPPHATLLGVIATDAAIEPAALQKALNYAVDRSFNSITVDGDMSTNDSIVALANGAAVPEDQAEIKEGSPEFETFKKELRSFAEELAQLVVRDGEGATKFVTVRVQNAPTFEVANAVAKSIASSSLVKCAMYGEDANWGRILCAV
jgi:glutamate N-acetyltransferase/amino-acid N-acetyltransferase